jgi:hypothetical protein
MHTYLSKNEVLVEVEDEVRVEEVAAPLRNCQDGVFAQGLTPRETKPVPSRKTRQATGV